jgi:hypothetical protein
MHPRRSFGKTQARTGNAKPAPDQRSVRATAASPLASARNSSDTVTAYPREVTTLKLRDEWVRLAAVQTLPSILRVVGMRLAHFYNGKTGQLNPSYATLAGECGTSERTAQRAVAAFRKLGMIADTRVPGGHHDATNDFTLIIPYRRVSTRTPVGSRSGVSERTPVKSKSGAQTGVRTGSGRVTSSVFDGCPPSHPNSVRENSVRNSERAVSGARTADDARESALTNSTKTSDDAPSNQRASHEALIDSLAAQKQPSLERDKSIGAGPDADADDPTFAPVYQRGREVLGADADAVTAKLLAAYDGHADSALDTLAVAADEADPRQYIERDIEAAARDQARSGRQ